jgi:hypothetical protein
MVKTTGPRVLPAAPLALEVCSGCRPCRRCRQHGHQPVSMLNWVTMGTMGGRSVWYCTMVFGSTRGTLQSGHRRQETLMVRSMRSGGGVGRSSALWPGRRPAFFLHFFSLVRRKCPAWRCGCRRASSSSWRRWSLSFFNLARRRSRGRMSFSSWPRCCRRRASSRWRSRQPRQFATGGNMGNLEYAVPG